MTDCDRFAPRLADLLVGALDAEEGRQVLAHVEACPACGEKLGELGRLEESLASLSRAPASPRVGLGSGLALAVLAVVVAATLLYLGLRTFSGLEGRDQGPRLLSGELAVAGRPLRGDRVPGNVPLAAQGIATVALKGALLEAGPEATFALVGPRELRLRAGEVALQVEPLPQNLTIHTPLGTVSTIDTAGTGHADFAVLVQQPTGAAMNLTSTTSITTAAAVAVLVTSGAVLFRSTGDGATPPAEVRLQAGDMAVARQGSLEVTRPSSLAEAAAAHSAAVSKLEKENETLKAELARAQARTAELEHQLSGTAPESTRGASAAAGSPSSGPAAAPLKGPRIAFDSLRDVDALSKVDWHKAGEASKRTGELIREMMAHLKAGEPIPAELNLKLVDENNKLVKVATTLQGKLPTWATGNGEYTHPVVLANIEAEHLVAAGLPLTDDQIAAIVALGAEYDARWKAAQAGYGDSTLLLDKTLDELELKKVFCDRMDAVLTPEQQGVLFDPATRHELQVDLYSPMLMVIMSCQPYAKATLPELRKSIVSSWSAALELDETHRTDVDLAVGTLLSQVQPPTVALAEIRNVKIDEALVAGRANAAALRELLRPLAGDAEAKAAIENVQYFYVPRVYQKP